MVNNHWLYLRSPGWPWQRFRWFLVPGLLHRGDVLPLVLRHEGVQGGASLVLLLVELVDDDPHKQVEGEESAEHNEGHEIDVLVQIVLIARLVILLEEITLNKEQN